MKKRSSKLPQFKTAGSNIPQFGKKKDKSPLKKEKGKETSYIKIAMKKDTGANRRNSKQDASPDKKSGLVMELPLRESKKRIYPTRNKKLNIPGSQLANSEVNPGEEDIDTKLMKSYRSGNVKKKEDSGIKGLLGPYLDSFKNNISYPIKPQNTEKDPYKRSKTDLGGVNYKIEVEEDKSNYDSRYKSNSIQENGSTKLSKTPKKSFSKPKYSSAGFMVLGLIMNKVRNRNIVRTFNSMMIKAFDIKMKTRSAKKVYQIKNKYRVLKVLKANAQRKKKISSCYKYVQKKEFRKRSSKRVDTFFDDAIPNQMDLPTPQQLDVAPSKPVLMQQRSKSPNISKGKKKTPTKRKNKSPKKRRAEPPKKKEEEEEVVNEIALLMEKMFTSQKANE